MTAFGPSSAGTVTTSKRALHERWMGAAYAAAPLSVWIIYWLAFYPGCVAHDSLVQWQEILDGRYDDWHPAFHTWTLWLVTRPWRSLAAVSLAQVLITALLVGRFLVRVRQLGAPAWAVWSVVAWLSLSPVFGMNVIAVWKDTAFGIAVLFASGVLLAVLGRGTVTVPDGGRLGLALALVWLYRHNGPAVVLPTFAAVALWCRRVDRPGLLAAGLTCAALVGFVKGPLYHVVHVAPASPKLAQQNLIHQVGAFLSEDTPLTENEEAVLSQILPLPVWRSAYVCHSGNQILFKSGLRTGLLGREPLALAAIWVRLVARNPRALLHHWLCVTRFIWSPHSRLHVGLLSEQGDTVDANELGVRSASKLPSAQRFLAGLVGTTSDPRSAARVPLWQPAVPLYLLVGSLAVAVWRARSAAPLLVWLPALSNTVVWLALAFSPSLRFQWPVILLGPLLACLATADWRRICGRALDRPRG